MHRSALWFPDCSLSFRRRRFDNLVSNFFHFYSPTFYDRFPGRLDDGEMPIVYRRTHASGLRE